VLRGRHHIYVRVLDEIPPAEFANLPVEALIADVRGRIATALAEQ
jgi:hypothetical protein